jgi:RND family efflux transporter MFP subunit
MLRRFLKPGLLSLAGLSIGVLLLIAFILNRQGPAHSELVTDAPNLSVVKVALLDFRFEARGFGITRPAETWQAVANVAGRVVKRHPGLQSGTLLAADTLLLTLDPSRYQLAIAETQAELASLTAEQNQLEVEKSNTQQLLNLERERLALSEGELGRLERLAATNAISRSRLDEQHRATLAQRQAVQTLNNQLTLIPSRHQYLVSRTQRMTAQLQQARQDLEDTRFFAPYDLRVREVSIETYQYASVGQSLFLVDSIEQAEVEAQVPLTMLRRLMAAVPVPVEPNHAPLDISERLDFSAIDSEVALVGFANVSWPARLSRVASGLDPGTRSARVVVTVEEPYRLAKVPQRPALQRDMYVQVRFSAPSPDPLLVVPASAVHQGEVYLVDKENRLERRAVTVAFEQHDLAVISAGLAPGDLVIVDDPVPAVSGMAILPQRNSALEQQLQQLALGQIP